MSSTQTAILGAIAGLTIFLGLPIGRVRSLSSKWRTALNGLAAGVLLFLVFEFVEGSVDLIADGPTALRAVLFVGTLVISLGALIAYGQRLRSSKPKLRPSGPGAAATSEMATMRASSFSIAQKFALLVAVGIGLHNLAEGLAIGQSAASGQYSLALLLIIGFALHNATEGFGIVGPMAAAGERASWSFLALLGVIGGLPVFVGTLIGQVWINGSFEVAILGFATGSVAYVLYEMGRVALRNRHWLLLSTTVALGIAIGFATELIIELGAGS
jgi:ZIP family zinc transporter